jgi:hypothetical protein
VSVLLGPQVPIGLHVELDHGKSDLSGRRASNVRGPQRGNLFPTLFKHRDGLFVAGESAKRGLAGKQDPVREARL